MATDCKPDSADMTAMHAWVVEPAKPRPAVLADLIPSRTVWHWWYASAVEDSWFVP